MNIALIFPRTRYPSGDTHLGVAYLASYLRNKIDCKIKILDTTFHPNYITYIKNKNIDAVVIGEGEEVLFDFVKNFNIPEEVAGIAYRENGSIKISSRSRPLIDDLDSIPYPAWDLLEMERYKRLATAVAPRNDKLLPNAELLRNL